MERKKRLIGFLEEENEDKDTKKPSSNGENPDGGQEEELSPKDAEKQFLQQKIKEFQQKKDQEEQIADTEKQKTIDRFNKVHSKLGRLLATPLELAKLDKEREEDEKREKESDDGYEDGELDEAKGKKPAVKKPAVKKPAVKKPAVKKPAVKKPAVEKKLSKPHWDRMSPEAQKAHLQKHNNPDEEGTVAYNIAHNGWVVKGSDEAGEEENVTGEEENVNSPLSPTPDVKKQMKKGKEAGEEEAKAQLQQARQLSGGEADSGDYSTKITKIFKQIHGDVKNNVNINPQQKKIYYDLEAEMKSVFEIKNDAKRKNAIEELIDRYGLEVNPQGQLYVNLTRTKPGIDKGSNDAKKGIKKVNSQRIIDIINQNGIDFKQEDKDQSPQSLLGKAAKPNLGTNEIRRVSDDINAKKIFADGPLSALENKFQQIYGPIDKNGVLLDNAKGKNAKIYLEHSISSNDALDKTIKLANSLEAQGRIDEGIAKEFIDHKKRLQNVVSKMSVPSSAARKAVADSYAMLACNLYKKDKNIADGVMKQIGEMALYDSELAGGDECYLPAHGSFPSADKLLVEKGKGTKAERISGISVKFGLAGGKWGFYGFPGETSKYQLFHPDKKKRDMLSSRPGSKEHLCGIKNDYIDNDTMFYKLIKDSKMSNCIKNEKKFYTFMTQYKKDIEAILESTKGKGGAKYMKKLKALDLKYADAMKGHINEEELKKMVGGDNADLAMRSGPGCMMSVIGFSNILQTSKGLPFIQHNHQVFEDGKYSSRTDDSSTGTINIKLWRLGWRVYDERAGGCIASFNSERKTMTNEKPATRKRGAQKEGRSFEDMLYNMNMLVEYTFDEIEILEDEEEKSKLRTHFETYELVEDD